MKNILKIGLTLLLSTFFLSCGDEIGGGNVNCDQAGPPVFTSSITTVSGAVSIDFKFKINQPAIVYLVVFNADRGDVPAEEIKERALSTSNSNLMRVRKAITLNCNDVSGGEITITADERLEHGTTVYAYLVAESTTQDEILQAESTRIEVDLLDVQPVETFQSAAENREVLFLLYTPENFLKYPDNEDYPAIIFLGGNGETTTQGEINLIKNGTIPQFIDRGGSIPFFVFSPQHIQNNWNEDMLNEMVEHAKANYPIDPDRIHMTGISGGGIGTWRYAINYADQLASIVPISGSGNTNSACEMANLAVWAFHNDTDGVVSTSGSVNMINAINDCPPATPAQLTLFEDDGHNAWRRVYDENHPDWDKTTVSPINIYDWLIDQSR